MDISLNIFVLLYSFFAKQIVFAKNAGFNMIFALYFHIKIIVCGNLNPSRVFVRGMGFYTTHFLLREKWWKGEAERKP